MAFVGAVGLHMTKRMMKVRGSMTNMLLFNMFFLGGRSFQLSVSQI